MSKDEAFFTWYEGMICTIEDAKTDAELSFFHDHRTACKAAWDARSDLIPKMPEDVAGLVALLREEAEHGAVSCAMDAADTIEALAARIAELKGALRDMRDDRAGFRHPAHFRRRAAVVLQGSRAALGETPAPPNNGGHPMKTTALKKLRDKVAVGARLEDMHEAPAALGTAGQTTLFIASYRGSLDAAKALHEALLPGWHVADLNVNGRVAGHPWGVCLEYWNAENPALNKRVSAGWGRNNIPDNNPARAWLLAILDALIAQEDG